MAMTGRGHQLECDTSIVGLMRERAELISRVEEFETVLKDVPYDIRRIRCAVCLNRKGHLKGKWEQCITRKTLDRYLTILKGEWK